MASHLSSSEGILVPAFTGLGAPYWDLMRAAILGLTLNSGREQIESSTGMCGLSNT